MKPNSILALDVGDKRIGIAVARRDVRLARPLVTLANDDSFWNELGKLVQEHEVGELVIGLPRGLDGQETGQTKAAQAFASELQTHVSLPVYMIDEAVTSVKAEQELQRRGKPYKKSAIDALAATFILEDYLNVKVQE
jgi:putative Holliday junction resolvase